MTDIVERLRKRECRDCDICPDEAADAIERLRGLVRSAYADWKNADDIKDAEIERLLGACKDKSDLLKDAYAQIDRLREQLDIARLALSTPMLGDIPS